MTDSQTARLLDTLRARIVTRKPAQTTQISPAGVEVRKGSGPLSLADGRVHEILPDRPGHGAALGFAVRCLAGAQAADNRPVMWITGWQDRAEDGRLYAPGLLQAGLSPERLLCVAVRREKDTLWVAEEALGSDALAGVAAHVTDLALTPSRRLALAAERTGTPLFLLRPARANGATAAETRWRVTPLPSLPDPFDAQAPGAAVWRLDLLRHRAGPPGTWEVACQGDVEEDGYDTQDALDLATPARHRTLAAHADGTRLHYG